MLLQFKYLKRSASAFRSCGSFTRSALLGTTVLFGSAGAASAAASDYTASTYAELVNAINNANANLHSTITLTANIAASGALPTLTAPTAIRSQGNNSFKITGGGAVTAVASPIVTAASISATSGSAAGLTVQNGATAINAIGATLTGAAGAAGVSLVGGGTFTNFGGATTSGPVAAATGVSADNGAVTVNLYAGSITSKVALGGGDDTVSLYTGNGTSSAGMGCPDERRRNGRQPRYDHRRLRFRRDGGGYRARQRGDDHRHERRRSRFRRQRGRPHQRRQHRGCGLWRAGDRCRFVDRQHRDYRRERRQRRRRRHGGRYAHQPGGRRHLGRAVQWRLWDRDPPGRLEQRREHHGGLDRQRIHRRECDDRWQRHLRGRRQPRAHSLIEHGHALRMPGSIRLEQRCHAAFDDRWLHRTLGCEHPRYRPRARIGIHG